MVIPGSNQEGRHQDPSGLHSRNSSHGGMTNKVNGAPSDTNGSTSIIDSVRQDSEPTAADNLKTLVQECGVSPHKISELLHEIPPQRFSEVLIDYYFSSM